MYIVMNRFQITEGREDEFEEIWRSRDSYLDEVEGFREFHLLKGEGGDFISHTTWADKSAFDAWVGSESFHKAHARAGDTPQDIFAGPPQVTQYEVLLSKAK